MKKVKIFLISLSFFMCLFFLYGCKNNNSGQTPSLYENYLSEYRKNLFINKTSNYLVTLTSGMRENDYNMNGEKTNLVDFGVITVKFDKLFAGSKLQFELKVDNDTYVGEFERNPYDNSFVYDIGKQVSDNSVINVYIVEFDERLDLKCASSNWQYNYKDALDIFIQNHKSQIENLTEKNTLQGEIFIKIVAENNNLNDIYWYCLLVSSNGEMYASLISVHTGEILQNS